MRVDHKCTYEDCKRTCFYYTDDLSGPRFLEDKGWAFKSDGRVLCPPHAEYLHSLEYFDQFAAF